MMPPNCAVDVLQDGFGGFVTSIELAAIGQQHDGTIVERFHGRNGRKSEVSCRMRAS